MRHFLILEPDLYGHKFDYTRYLIDQALADGHQVSSAVQPNRLDDLRSKELRATYGDSVSYLEVEGRQVTASTIRYALRQDMAWTDIVVPSADRLLFQLPWTDINARLAKSNTRLRALLMRPPLHRSRWPRDLVKKWMLLLLSRQACISMNCLVGPGMMVRGSNPVPDPVVISTTEGGLPEELVGLDSSRFWFGIVGTIWPRKNPELVVRALKLCSDLPQSGLIVAGHWDPGLWSKFSRLALYNSNVDFRFVNRGLSDNELDSTIAWLDCVVVAHTNEGSSGILGKAAAVGTRVAAAGARSLREDVQAIGGTWCRLKVEELARELQGAVHRPQAPPQECPTPSEFAQALLYDQHPLGS